MTKKTQLAILGAGPGGYTAAFYASDMGLEVTLIDQNPVMGGVCLNQGCIPSKFFLHLAKLIQEVEEVKEMGLSFGKVKIDLEKIRNYKEKILQNLSQGLQGLARARKVTVLTGKASFIGLNRLAIEGKNHREELDFGHAIVATGSTPFIPPSLNLSSPNVMDSKDALELKNIPETLLVVGGGVIGLELGSVYSALGSKVTVVELLEEIALGVDPDLLQPLKKILTQKFEKIYTSTKVVKLEEKNKRLYVHLEKDGKKWEEIFHSVLISTGRIPNTKTIGLEKIGVQIDSKGLISVNQSLQSTIPHIYAIGDVVSGPMLAHKASKEGKVAVNNICNQKEIWEQRGIPSVIYTDPEIAWVGLTEESAKSQQISYKVGLFPWQASGRARTINRTEGLTKILFDPDTKRVLGAGIVGVGAGELIGEATLALEMSAVVEDLSETIHSHPTLSETLLESAEDFHGMATHFYHPKK